ncbi:MAG: hypothetical protein ACRDVL_02130 [Acidimicrobiia bacterium]
MGRILTYRKEVLTMWRFLFVAFLVAHGGIHLAIWATPVNPEVPFDATRSWLLGNQRALAMVLAIAIAAVLVAAGLGLWAHADWWRPVAVVGLAGSLGLMVLFFNPWFLLSRL